MKKETTKSKAFSRWLDARRGLNEAERKATLNEMKNYLKSVRKAELNNRRAERVRSLEKYEIGGSDIATVLFQGCGESGLEAFNVGTGGDGDYYLRESREPIVPPAHYRLEKTIKQCYWIRVFNDKARTYATDRPIKSYTTLEIWRAGFTFLLVWKKS